MAMAQADLAALSSRSLVHWFVDVKTAFAAMVRSLALPGAASDDVYIGRLLSSGVSFKEAADIFHACQDPELFSKLYPSSHAALLLSTIVDLSWLSVDYTSGILLPSSGCMAGTSYADFLFMAAFVTVMNRFD